MDKDSEAVFANLERVRNQNKTDDALALLGKIEGHAAKIRFGVQALVWIAGAALIISLISS